MRYFSKTYKMIDALSVALVSHLKQHKKTEDMKTLLQYIKTKMTKTQRHQCNSVY